MWWKAQVVIHTSISILLALFWSIQLVRQWQMHFLSKETVFWNNMRFLSLQEMRDANHRTRTIQAESESINMSAGKDTGFLTRVNPLQYEEGR